MSNRSVKNEDDSRAFIGFYADPAAKRAAQRRAEEEGLSLSEWMRRRLDEVGEDGTARAPA